MPPRFCWFPTSWATGLPCCLINTVRGEISRHLSPLLSRQILPSVFWSSVMRCVPIYNCFIFLLSWPFHHYELSLFVSNKMLPLKVDAGRESVDPGISITSGFPRPFTRHSFFQTFTCKLSVPLHASTQLGVRPCFLSSPTMFNFELGCLLHLHGLMVEVRFRSAILLFVGFSVLLFLPSFVLPQYFLVFYNFLIEFPAVCLCIYCFFKGCSRDSNVHFNVSQIYLEFVLDYFS